MADWTVTNTFSNGTTADADEVNTNFTDVETKTDGMWTLIEEVEASGAASVDFTSISGYKLLKVVWDLASDNDGVSMWMRINNDSAGGDYEMLVVSGNTWTQTTGNNEFTLSEPSGASDKTQTSGQVIMPVKHDRDSSPGRICATFSASCAQPATTNCITGPANYIASADVTRITILASAGNITGYANLYGVLA